MNRISVSISLIYLIFLCVVACDKSYYLDSKSTCSINCGDFDTPFASFKDAIIALKEKQTPTLIVQPGDYFGNDNKGIVINFDISIESLRGSTETFIDCQNAGNGFVILGESTTFSITGFTIKNCNAGRGGALYTSNSITNIKDIIFLSNSARLGSAIYSSSPVFNIEECLFYYNRGGFSVYFVGVRSEISHSVFNLNNNNDLYCSSGSTVFSLETKLGSICNDCNVLTALSPDSNNICGEKSSIEPCNYDGQCQTLSESNENCPSDCPSQVLNQCNNDKICDSSQGETFETCPFDCDSDYHPGWRLDVYENSILNKPTKSMAVYSTDAIKSSTEFVPLSVVKNFMSKKHFPVSARMVSQVKVDKDGYYFFKLDTKNINAVVFVNGRVVFDTFMNDNTPSHSSQRKILMSQDKTTDVEIVFLSLSNNQRDISLEWRHESESTYQLIPSYYITIKEEYSCGDGICNENQPETCLIDCYAHMEKICPGQSPPAPLKPEYGDSSKDTISTLLNNQYLFSLPGIHHMSHGIDIRTGVSNPTPIFALTYCDNSSFSLVQDPFRDLVYTVPEGLYAQMASKCTQDTTSSTYSSSSQMSKEKSEDKSLDVSVNADGGTAFISVAISASLSLSESTQSASETENKQDGSLINTELNCEVSKVHLVQHRFHPKFIQDIARSLKQSGGVVDDGTTDRNLENVIKKYGSLYYKSATLGGKLEIHTVTDHSYSRTKTSTEIENSIDMSASGQITSPVFSGSASASGSIDTKTEASDQQEFEKSSSRSTVIVSGGEPGSYGKDSPNSFATWASTVDLVPVPIDYQAGYIADIIPPSWYLTKGYNVQQMWSRLEMGLYKNYFLERERKYLADNDLFKNLQKTETIYHISNVYVAGSNCTFYGLTITDFNDVKYFYPQLRFTFDHLHDNLVLPTTSDGLVFSDIKGIKSFVYEGLFQGNNEVFRLANIDFYNIFTARVYNFVNDGPGLVSRSFALMDAVPNRLDFEFKDYSLVCSGTCIVTLNIYSDLHSGSTQIHVTGSTISFTTNGYIGKILGFDIEIDTLSNNGNEDPSIYVQFSNLLIKQSCPNDAYSKCIPKNVVFNSKYGYIKAYELYSLTNTPFKYIFTEFPKWNSIELLGN